MLFIGLSISVSADEIIGEWIFDRKVSLSKAKIKIKISKMNMR